jgi:hypothetical protein
MQMSLSGPRAIGCMVMRFHGGTKAREVTVNTDGTSLSFQVLRSLICQTLKPQRHPRLPPVCGSSVPTLLPLNIGFSP